MTHLYHRVPEEMRGDILYPLNILKDREPDLYTKEVAKYVGREYLLLDKIPTLDCLWNDVLHFTAVHPTEIKKALVEAGRSKPFNEEFFEIDPRLLNSKNTVVYLYQHQDRKDKLKEANFASYNPEQLGPYAVIPPATKEYYKEMFSQGKRPLTFHRIPHILFKGSLETSALKRIKLV